KRREQRQPRRPRYFRSTQPRKLFGAPGTGPRHCPVRMESYGIAASRRIARRDLPRVDEIGNRQTNSRRGSSSMRNVFTICGKELKSYFTSPIAYLLMALFGLIFGYFFFSATVFFVNAGLRAQAGGGNQPMSVNDYVVAPLLGNASVIALFLIPLISMRLFAEEKRSGTIELLMTSPVRDWEIILGK